MSLSAEFRTFIQDQMAGFGSVTVKRMFGGGGVYHDSLMFALISGDVLYFKVDDETRPLFEKEGLPAFTIPPRKGKIVALPYHRAPERCLDDPAEMAQWCRLAYGAAVRAAKRNKPKSRKRLKTS